MTRDLDLLVLGSGVAGLSAAVRAADTHGMRVGVLTKGELHQATTRWAQGGVAAVLGADEDSTDLHLADTLRAGAGLCESAAVRVLVDEGPSRVNELISLGAIFDRDARGELELAREGGHSLPRVVHAGGAATGHEIERALVEAVQLTAAHVYEHHFALDLLVESGRCRGLVALTPDGARLSIRSANVLVATGGAGQLFAVTTNPPEASADGVAMAIRAGVPVADLEFIQFHPTALHHEAMPRPLLSEALRGHGALLRDKDGERFVDELLPRDVVSRAMAARMLDQHVDHLWLDATELERFTERFPTIAHALEDVGLDPGRDWLPIAPAAHFLCGGIVTDLDGATALPGLWAAGEVACVGVHGANRLASNSLLEGMVFGPRVVEAIDWAKTAPEPTGVMRSVVGTADAEFPGVWVDLDLTGSGGRDPADRTASDPATARAELQRAMTDGAGVLRSAESLAATRSVAERVRTVAREGTSVAHLELENLSVTALAVLRAATAREESRGAHTRMDHPDTLDEFRCRLLIGDPQVGGSE